MHSQELRLNANIHWDGVFSMIFIPTAQQAFISIIQDYKAPLMWRIILMLKRTIRPNPALDFNALYKNGRGDSKLFSSHNFEREKISIRSLCRNLVTFGWDTLIVEGLCIQQLWMCAATARGSWVMLRMTPLLESQDGALKGYCTFCHFCTFLI